MSSVSPPLAGLRVLDFSTLLPGPLATLLLAEAGAEVTKIERPGTGDEMRDFAPSINGLGVNFALLNRGKRSLALDLKEPAALARAHELIAACDVLVEQFRPGVMRRLGLDYARARTLNPRLIYCSITGYGQRGEGAHRAGHDLNYLAETGLLALGADAGGQPVIPPALIADIAGGSYPAVMNVLLALRARERDGVGCHLDIAMSDNLFPFMFWAQAELAAGNPLPQGGRAWATGGSPRYQIYATADGGYVAAAPLEERFWQAFCDVVDLPAQWRGRDADAAGCIAEVARRIAAAPGAHWRRAFAAADCCCNLVRPLDEAMRDAHFRARGLFSTRVPMGERLITALVSPLAARFRTAALAPAPATPGGE